MRHPRTAGEKKPNGLSDFLDFYGMPTPVASDAGGGAVMGEKRQDYCDTEGKIRKNQSERPCLECWGGLRGWRNFCPRRRRGTGRVQKPGKPERREAGYRKNSLPDFFARTGKSFQLNPLFVAEMMGFPPGWTVSPFLSEEKVHQRIRKRHRPPGSLRDIQSNRRNL